MRSEDLQPTRHCKQLLVSFKLLSRDIGVLTMVTVLPNMEEHEYKLLRAERKHYVALMRQKNPQVLFNDLLRTYGLG